MTIPTTPIKTGWITFILLICSAMHVSAQTDYTLTADGNVGSDLSASPANLLVSGSNPYTYDTAGGTLDLSNYNIFSAGNSFHGTFLLDSLFYSGSGGVFDFSGDGSRGNLEVTASDTISLRSIDTSGLNINKSNGGHVTLSAPNGITIEEGVRTTHNGNANSGNLSLTSTNGTVTVGDEIFTGGDRRPGTVDINALGISVRDIEAGGVNTLNTVFGANVTLNAGSGGLMVDGSINNWGGQDSAGGGDVTITSTDGGDVTITGVITNQSHRTASAADGGNVNISSTGNISLGGLINSDSASTADGGLRGDLILTAENGFIQLAMLDVSLHNDITFNAGLDTHILGDLLGLDSFLSGNTVTRFTDSVIGNIFYDPGVANNSYLGGQTYDIQNTSYSLIAIPEPGTLALVLIFGVGFIAYRRRR